MANTPKDPRKKPVQKPESELYGTSNGMRIRTLILVAAFLIFGFGLLIYQLYVLQIRDYESYRVDATMQQLSDTPTASPAIFP